MPVDDQISNPTANRPFADVLSTRMSRRSMMTGSLATAAVAFFGQSAILIVCQSSTADNAVCSAASGNTV